MAALIFCSIFCLFPAFSSAMASSTLSTESSLSPTLFPLLAFSRSFLAFSRLGSGSLAFFASTPSLNWVFACWKEGFAFSASVASLPNPPANIAPIPVPTGWTDAF